MYGTVIGKSIAVDCFENVTKNGIYFMSEAQIVGEIPAHVDRVYTSSHNSWLLRTKYKVNPEKLVSLPTNQKFLIQDKVKKLDFYVTLLDAKQKPGAVMFLFEGEGLGNILYAGKCCYSDSFFSKPLTNFLKVKLVDYLYVHAACEDCHSHSMTTSAAVEDIINIVRWNPSCKIIIHEPFFREDILTNLRLGLRKPICVSENIMKHLEELGLGSDFQLDKSSAQVYITDKSIEKLSSSNQPVYKTLLTPCSMKLSSQEIQVKLDKLEQKGYHVILYRNHCSPPELVNLARSINARHTVLLRPVHKWRDPAQRPRDVMYWAHLGSFERIIQLIDRIDEQEKARTTTEDPAVEDIAEGEVQDNDKEVEANMPESFILIESDIESIASQETALNTPRT